MSSITDNPIPPWERIAVDARTAAWMLSCGRSTFFERVKNGTYPKPGKDGKWGVEALRPHRRLAPAAPGIQAAIPVPRRQIERMPRSVPLGPGTHHLYRHFDASGRLLYVGISLHAIARLAEHKQTAAWFWNIARVEVTAYATKRTAAKAERMAVQREKPLHNIVHASHA